MRKALLLVLLLPAIAFAAGRELAPRELGPSPYFANDPQMAYAQGRFLTVWRESRDLFGSRIAAAVTDAAGRPVTPSFTIVSTDATQTHVVSTGDAFFVFLGPQMFEIDLDGRIIARHRVAIPQLIGRIAWNGTHFLAVLPNNWPNTDAEGVLFTRTGEIVRRGIVLTSMYQWVEVVADGADFVVLTSARDGLFADRVSASGAVTRTLLDEAGGVLPGAYRPYQVVAAPRAEGGLLVMWSTNTNHHFEIKSAIVGADGAKGGVHTLAASEDGLFPIAALQTSDGYTVAFAETRHDSTGTTLSYMTAMTLDENAAPVAKANDVFVGNRPVDAATGSDVIGTAYTSLEWEHQQILQRVIRANGTMRDEQVVSIAPARQQQPSLGTGGGQYVAAFTEDSPASRVRTAVVTADGVPIGHRFIGEGTIRNADLAWNGNEYLAIVQRDSQRDRENGALSDRTLIAQRLNVDGEPVAGAAIIANVPSDDTRVAVAWAEDRWVVVWAEYDLYFATVSASGIVSTPRKLALPTPLEPQWTKAISRIAVAADGPRVLLAWIESQNPPFAHPPVLGIRDVAFAQRIRRDGTFIDPEPIRLAESDLTFAISATAGADFAVVVDTRTQSLLVTLESIATPLRILNARVLPFGFSDVAWDTQQYIVAQRFVRDWPNRLIVRRFDEQLQEVEPMRGVVTLPADEVRQPSIAAANRAEVMVAIQEGDPDDGGKAVVYLERDMEPLRQPVRRRTVRH